MSLEKLRFVPVAELNARSATAALAVSEAREVLIAAQARKDEIATALLCHRHGAWVGDTVRVEGRHKGKVNPTGVLAGFDYNMPLVRLHRKDGSLPDESTRTYGGKLTKI